MKKTLSILLVMAFTLCMFCACGTGDSASTSNNHLGNENVENLDIKADESFFEWDGNLITAVTASGAQQTNILIPARCEGFCGVIFQNTSIKYISFEDQDDIALDFAFMGAEQVVSVTLPNNLTTIPSMSFKGCTSLTSISFPSTVNTLDGYAFKGCSNLETVEFKGDQLKTIGENSFEDCTALKTLTIPNGVSSVEKYAFFGCSSLTDVKLSSSVKKIAKFAFGNTGITEIHLPADITFETMDTSAFGVSTYTMVVYIAKGSWCDQNQNKWDIGFGEIKYE